jgi:uncharacterized membrane protein
MNTRKLGLFLVAFVLLALVLVACQAEPEVVEVTRVVTETEVVEGEVEVVEVTRVTETEVVVAEVPAEEAQEQGEAVEATPEEVVDVIATLTVLKEIVEVNGQTVIEEVDLSEGDVIETGDTGFARITYFDDPDMFTELEPGTILSCDSLQPGGISYFQEHGSTYNVLESAIKIDYRITTPSSIVIDMGTRSIVHVDPIGHTDIAVEVGEVLVEMPDGSTVTVQQGQRTKADVDGTADPPSDTIFVALDLSHMDEENDGSVSIRDFDRLENAIEKHQVIWITDLEYSTLKNKNVLMLVGSEKRYYEEEIEGIWDWVEEGGGLFVVGEHANYTPFQEFWLNQLLAPYGIQFIGYSDSDMEERAQSASEFNDHPVTDGISTLPLGWTNALEGGNWLAKTDDELTILSSAQNSDRVLVLADTYTLIDSAWEEQSGRDLDTFFLNAIEWLAWWR